MNFDFSDDAAAYAVLVKMINEEISANQAIIEAIMVIGAGLGVIAKEKEGDSIVVNDFVWRDIHVFKAAEGLVVVMKSPEGLVRFGRYTQETLPPTIVISYEPHGGGFFNCYAKLRRVEFEKIKKTDSSIPEASYQYRVKIFYKFLSGSGNNRLLTTTQILANYLFSATPHD